jgi:hypothetical protein
MYVWLALFSIAKNFNYSKNNETFWNILNYSSNIDVCIVSFLKQ